MIWKSKEEIGYLLGKVGSTGTEFHKQQSKEERKQYILGCNDLLGIHQDPEKTAGVREVGGEHLSDCGALDAEGLNDGSVLHPSYSPRRQRPVDPEPVTPLLKVLQWLPSHLELKPTPSLWDRGPAYLPDFISHSHPCSPAPSHTGFFFFFLFPKRNQACSPLGTFVLQFPLPGMQFPPQIRSSQDWLPLQHEGFLGGDPYAHWASLMSQCRVAQQSLTIRWPHFMSSHLALSEGILFPYPECLVFVVSPTTSPTTSPPLE